MEDVACYMCKHCERLGIDSWHCLIFPDNLATDEDITEKSPCKYFELEF